MFKRTWLKLAFIFALSINLAYAADPNSKYLQLGADISVTTSQQIVLSTTVSLSAPRWVYVQSDGRYYPMGSTVANMFIAVNGARSSNDSTIDWANTSNPQQHSYNNIGAVYLPAGTHSFQLVGEVVQGSGFVVGSGSNLSIMVNPATNVIVKALGSDAGPYNFTTQGVSDGMPVPSSTVMSSTVSTSGQPIVAMMSGRQYHAGASGDPMWGIYLNNDYTGNNAASWAINDSWSGAETQSPMHGHAFFTPATGHHTTQLRATEFPWTGGENGSIYKIGYGTRLITLHGGMTVRGRAPISSTKWGYHEYISVGRGPQHIFPGCGSGYAHPCVGTNVKISESTFTVPSGHNGIVFFSAKTQVQGDMADGGGTVRLWLELDGVPVGSTGIQQLAYPSGESQRTINASYLAAGSNAISPGQHVIRVFARANYRPQLQNPESSFKHVSVTKYLPLIWFD